MDSFTYINILLFILLVRYLMPPKNKRGKSR
jgi:hypothetical protein